MLFSRSLALVSVFASSALAVSNADINGLSFIQSSTKGRLQIVGVDYQPGGQSGYDPASKTDILSDGDVCLRDAALLQKLGVNTIRVYNINPGANHDVCMSIFNAAGIYVIVDVNSPFESINRADPGSSYTIDYLKYIFGAVENFKGYPNTLAFFAANEVMNDVPSAKSNPPYIRAVQRDLRQYIAKQSTRHIPVGYSAADVREILEDTWAYLQCTINGTDDSRSEFFGLNSYSWCGADATFQSAGYDKLVSMFASTSIPVFFSEYGCNLPKGQPRPFNEVQALYGSQMTNFNGGLVYEYSEEESDYGLVVLNSNNSVTLRADYDNLQSQYNKLDTKALQSTAAVASAASPPACNPSLISSSGFSTDFNIPAQPSGVAALINNGIPNPNRGKIVNVPSLDVKLAVYGSDGKAVTGLSVKQTTDGNLPNGQTTSGSAGNSTTHKKGAAPGRPEGSALAAAFAGLVGVVLALSI